MPCPHLAWGNQDSFGKLCALESGFAGERGAQIFEQVGEVRFGVGALIIIQRGIRTAMARAGTAIGRTGTAVARAGTAIALTGTAVARTGTAMARIRIAITGIGSAIARIGIAAA